MPSLSEIEAKDQRLIRKYLQGAVFAALGNADAITNMMSGVGELLALPTGYRCVGYVTEDGYTAARETDGEQTMSDGSTSVTRWDRTQDTKTMSFSMQEANAASIGLYADQDTAALAADPNGEFAIEYPDVAIQNEWRMFYIGADNKPSDGTVFRGVFLPRAVVSEFGEETLSSRSISSRNVTMTGLVDDTLGFDRKDFYASTSAILTAMGVDASAIV